MAGEQGRARPKLRQQVCAAGQDAFLETGNVPGQGSEGGLEVLESTSFLTFVLTLLGFGLARTVEDQ